MLSVSGKGLGAAKPRRGERLVAIKIKEPGEGAALGGMHKSGALRTKKS